MAVTNTPARADYNCNGSTTSFPIPFYFLSNSHVKALLTNEASGAVTPLVYGTDYTLTGAGVEAGGNATTLTAYATGNRLTFKRNVNHEQGAEYEDGDAFPAASHERALDYLTMQAQQLSEAQGRALTLPETTAMDVDPTLPIPEAGRVIGWSSDGKSLVSYPPTSGSAGALQADLASAEVSKGSSMLTTKDTLSGAVARSQKDRNHDSLNPKDFGVVGDGVTDDSVAISVFFANMAAGVYGNCKRVVFPHGRYYIANTVTIPPFSNASMNLDQRSSDNGDWEIDFGRASFLIGCSIGFSLTSGSYPNSRNQTLIHNGGFSAYGSQAVTSVFRITGSSYWQLHFKNITANKLYGSIGSLFTMVNDDPTHNPGVITFSTIHGVNISNIVKFTRTTGTVDIDNLIVDDIYHICNDAAGATIILDAMDLYAPRIQKVVHVGLGTMISGSGRYITNGDLSSLYSEPSTTGNVNLIVCHLSNTTVANCKAYILDHAVTFVRWLVGLAVACRIDNVHVEAGSVSGAHPYLTVSTYKIMYLDGGNRTVFSGYTSTELKNCLALATQKELGVALGVSDDVGMMDYIAPNPTGISTATTTTLIPASNTLNAILASMSSAILDVEFLGYSTNVGAKTVQCNLVIGSNTINIGSSFTQGQGAWKARGKVVLAPASATTAYVFVLHSESMNQAGTVGLSSVGMINISSALTVNLSDAVSANIVTSSMAAGSIYPIAVLIKRMGRGLSSMVNA